VNNNPPLREPAGARWSPSWSIWFQQVFNCLAWNNAISTRSTLNFSSVPSAGQLSLTVPVPGARVGDAVLLSARTDVAGLIFSGFVSVNNIVTVVAKNFTAAPIDPAAVVFRIIVIQD